MFRHRDYFELQLAFMWEDLLGTTDIYIRDDFFALGGDAERARTFLAELKREFKAEVSYEQFVSKATIEATAVHVRAAARNGGRKSSAARMQGTAPDEAPVVIIHDVRGDLLDLQQIRGSNIGRPIIGIRTPGVDLEEEPLQTYEEMAERYVADIQSIGVREPFLIAGNSNGGLIAYEMVMQLETAGKRVGYLGLFEPPLADGTGPNDDMSASVNRLIEEMCMIHDIPLDLDNLDACFEVLRQVDQIPYDYSSELILRTLDLNAINLRAGSRYRVTGKLSSPVVLYESRGGGGDDTRPTGLLSDCETTGNPYEAYWLSHLPPTTPVRRLPCSHRALFHRREMKTFLREDVAAAMCEIEAE